MEKGRERSRDRDVRDRWARLRFAVIGPLLSAPPKKGVLHAELDRLSKKVWKHPTTGEPVCFGRSTIEKWYYTAKKTQDPLQGLRQKLRRDCGRQIAISAKLRDVLLSQYRQHPSWSYRLHAQNLQAVIREQPSLGGDDDGKAPSEASVRRFLQSQGLFRQRKRPRDTEGARRAARRFEELEVRSFEVEYVGALWHLDFHEASRSVVTKHGERRRPILIGVLDDHSRLACHVQWYFSESAETLAHGLSQAIQKRGLPRALMTDNGAAMLAIEIQRGLLELGITHELTLPYSAYQNGKQEVFWTGVEGRLLAMLEGEDLLTLALLNQATQAWIERDYNHRFHSELGTTPAKRFLATPSVLRPSPGAEALRRAFVRQEERRQRKSDGTITVEGVRFEVPSRLESLRTLTVRYASWDLGSVDVVDEKSGVVLARILPLDRHRNAQRGRRKRDRSSKESGAEETRSLGGMAPLLRHMIEDTFKERRLPTYLPKEELDENASEESEEKER